jgi:Asp-tRNA(Asn)/Glu-tRNA(Gln) amidotransferase B subunit
MHAGANQLSGSDYSLVDCNRAGVPLLEVVSEPDMRDGAEAAAYGAELRRIVLFMGLTEGVMADGHLRFDVNVSVHALRSIAPCESGMRPLQETARLPHARALHTAAPAPSCRAAQA